MAEATYLGCLMCSYKTSKEDTFLSHVKKHEGQNNFRVPCGDCQQTFKNIIYYKKHRKRKNCKSEAFVEECNQKEKQRTDNAAFWQCKTVIL